MFGGRPQTSATTLREARQHAADAIQYSLEVSERHNLLTASLRDHLVDLTEEVSARDAVLRDQQTLIGRLQAREKHLEALVQRLQREATALRGHHSAMPTSPGWRTAYAAGTPPEAARTVGRSFAAALREMHGPLCTSSSASSVGSGPCMSDKNLLSPTSSAAGSCMSSGAGWSTSAFTSPATSLGGNRNLSDDAMRQPSIASGFSVYSNPLADTGMSLPSIPSCPLTPAVQRVRSCPGSASQPRKDGLEQQMQLEGLRVRLADVLLASEAAASSATASEAELRTLQRQYQALLEDKLCLEERSQQAHEAMPSAAAELQPWKGGEGEEVAGPRPPLGMAPRRQAQRSRAGQQKEMGDRLALARENDALRARVSELEGVLHAARAGAVAALSAVAAASLPSPAARGAVDTAAAEYSSRCGSSSSSSGSNSL